MITVKCVHLRNTCKPMLILIRKYALNVKIFLNGFKVTKKKFHRKTKAREMAQQLYLNCSRRRPKFGSQHPHQAAHNYL